MKKILALIFLGLLTANLNLYSVNEEQASKEKPEQFTKKDIAKITAATIGCAFFTYALLTSYNAKKFCHEFTSRLPAEERNKIHWPPLHYLPASIAATPTGLILSKFPESWKRFLSKNLCCSCSINHTAGAILSGALAYLSGSYVHKKFAKPKVSKQDQAAKKIAK